MYLDTFHCEHTCTDIQMIQSANFSSPGMRDGNFLVMPICATIQAVIFKEINTETSLLVECYIFYHI